jgi:hypothetical protein
VPYLRFFLVRNEEVVGSNPISSTKFIFNDLCVKAFLSDLCLAKRSYTFEINDLAYSLIRSFPLEFLP